MEKNPNEPLVGTRENKKKEAKHQDPIAPIEFLFILKRKRETKDSDGKMVHLANQAEEIEVYYFDPKDPHPEEGILIGEIDDLKSV